MVVPKSYKLEKLNIPLWGMLRRRGVLNIPPLFLSLLGVVLLELLTGLPAWDVDENGSVLTDRAVVDGQIEESLLDPAGQWPESEIVACSEQAIPGTTKLPVNPDPSKTGPVDIYGIHGYQCIP